jgi:hypothetical protein
MYVLYCTTVCTYVRTYSKLPTLPKVPSLPTFGTLPTHRPFLTFMVNTPTALTYYLLRATYLYKCLMYCATLAAKRKREKRTGIEYLVALVHAKRKRAHPYRVMMYLAAS